MSDILLAIERIELFTSTTLEFESYVQDLKTQSAVERQLGIVGEAVNNFRRAESEYSLSDTRDIVNFRNRLIHNYDGIDEAIVWSILKVNLPILKQEAILGLQNMNEE
ncbi:MAG: HepT-like ribonuclease domain-containing protein [Bacteroidota bacterium]